MKGKKFGSEAQRKAAMARLSPSKHGKPKAGKARGPLPPSRRLFELDVKLRPLLESRLGQGDTDAAMQASLGVLRGAPPGLLRDQPADLAKTLFDRLRRLHPQRDGDCLVVAAEAVRAAGILDRLDVLAKVRRRAEAEEFEDFSVRDGVLWTLKAMEGWLEAGRSMHEAVEQTRAKWGTAIPAGFALGVSTAFDRVTRAYGTPDPDVRYVPTVRGGKVVDIPVSVPPREDEA